MPRSSVFTVILAVFISTGQLSQPALSQDAKMLQKDIVVAKVEGQKIYRRELLRAFQGLPKEVKQTGLEVIYPKLVERLIQQRLLIIEGRAKKLIQRFRGASSDEAVGGRSDWGDFFKSLDREKPET